VRELVHRINDWRKSAGFSIDDRITIRYDATPKLAAAILRHDDFIRSEVLAVSLDQLPPTGDGFCAEGQLDGERLTAELHKA